MGTQQIEAYDHHDHDRAERIEEQAEGRLRMQSKKGAGREPPEHSANSRDGLSGTDARAPHGGRVRMSADGVEKGLHAAEGRASGDYQQRKLRTGKARTCQ